MKSNSTVRINSLRRGLIAGCISLITYLFIVIITTPNLHPLIALSAAIKANGIIIFGLAIAVGSQIYVSSYEKSLVCGVVLKKGLIVGTSGGTALSSFFSFFSLVPLGCCGSWFLILSLLPSVFGSSLSVILIQYSKPLSYLGLFIVIGYTVFCAIKLKRKLKLIEITKVRTKISTM